MKPIAGHSHAELAGAMRRLDGKAKGGETALGSNRSVQPEGRISYCRGGGGRRRLESGERAREGERGEKSMEEVTNILFGV
jgi:hypothetical protein